MITALPERLEPIVEKAFPLCSKQDCKTCAHRRMTAVHNVIDFLNAAIEAGVAKEETHTAYSMMPGEHGPQRYSALVIPLK